MFFNVATLSSLLPSFTIPPFLTSSSSMFHEKSPSTTTTALSVLVAEIWTTLTLHFQFLTKPTTALKHGNCIALRNTNGSKLKEHQRFNQGETNVDLPWESLQLWSKITWFFIRFSTGWDKIRSPRQSEFGSWSHSRWEGQEAFEDVELQLWFQMRIESLPHKIQHKVCALGVIWYRFFMFSNVYPSD